MLGTSRGRFAYVRDSHFVRLYIKRECVKMTKKHGRFPGRPLGEKTAVDCGLCQIRSSVGYCTECKVLLCEECSVACSACRKLVCKNHLLTTSHGRKLCRGCWELRKARRSASGTPESLEAMKEEAGFQTTREERALLTDEEDLASTESKRPSPSAYALATALFLAVGILLYCSIPDLGEILWPFKIKGPAYTQNLMAPIQDHNALRNASNIDIVPNRFSLFHVILAVAAWAFVSLYLFGLGAVALSLYRGISQKILTAMHGEVLILVKDKRAAEMVREASQVRIPDRSSAIRSADRSQEP